MPWIGEYSQLIDGQIIYLSIRAKNEAGLYSEVWSSLAIKVDLTTPTGLQINLPDNPEEFYNGYLKNTNHISVNLQASDHESKIDGYIVKVIPVDATLNDTSIEAITLTENLNITAALTGLTLTNGANYKVVAKVRNGAGEWSEEVVSSVFTVDSIPPELTFNTGNIIGIPNGDVTVAFTLTEIGKVRFVLRDLSNNVIFDTDPTNPTYNTTDGTYSFTVPSSGDYKIYAIPTDLAGNTSANVVYKSIHIKGLPNIIGTPHYTNQLGEMDSGATKGQELSFSVNAQDPDGYSLTYLWNFGDGSAPVSGEQVNHIFTELSSYQVTVRVTDPLGGSCDDQVIVDVTNTHKGRLYQAETWSGTHEITGDVLVPIGITLTIEPGTEVIINKELFTGNTFALIIQGNLMIQGSGQPVTFHSTTGQIGDWQGIYLEGQATMEQVIIQDAERGLTVVSGATATLTNCTFQHNQTGLHVYGANPSVNNSSFINNTLYGIKEDEGVRPIVTNCFFSGNGMDYYSETLTELTMDQLNQLEGNSGNHQ